MSKSVEQLLSEIQNKQILLNNLTEWEKQLQKDIKVIELNLWDTCTHKWVRDYNAPFDDICKWMCNQCGLYRDRDMYASS